MAIQVAFEYTTHQAMQLRPSQMQVGLAQMLALPALEMERAVAQELADNPALERVEEAGCRFCAGHAMNCPVCGIGLDVSARRMTRSSRSGDLDAATALAAEEQPRDILLRDLLTLVPASDRTLAEIVVASLDAHGFLDEAPDDLALLARVEPERIHRIVAALREVGHPGIAASDLRESLLLQLDSRSKLDAGGQRLDAASGCSAAEAMLARQIIAGHLKELARGRFSAIARALEITVDDVRKARAFIQRELTPSPADLVPGDKWASSRREPALPDLIIIERSDQPGYYLVELAEAIRCAVRVDPAWRTAAGSAAHPDQGSIRALVQRGDGFLAKVEGRWRTLRLIGAYVADRQQGFIRNGPSAMVALTRAEVAGALSLCESTVSRAVAGKFALLPSGRIVPLADFFDCSLQVRSELRTIIASEKRPLSDAELATALRARGHDVARRTVAKYRDRLGILPAALR